MKRFYVVFQKSNGHSDERVKMGNELNSMIDFKMKSIYTH